MSSGINLSGFPVSSSTGNNPGKDTAKADHQRKENIDAAKDFDKKDVDSFINSYIKYLKDFGKNDYDRLDNFDLKQAYFLKACPKAK